MSKNNKKKDRPDVDPYDALGVAVGATDAEISKAYKKLALKLHPDKQKSDMTESQRDDISKRFQEIQDARSFLLDVENQDARRKYDKIREGERLRKQADEIREKTMNINRKRMRDQLKEKEKIANNKKGSKKSSKSTTKDDELVDQLRKDGQKLRQAYAERDAQKEFDRQQRQQRKSTKESLEERQIRLKWDRKKMKGISPSEHSIATLFGEKFGPVEKVEFIGSKGNQALVTFMNSSSCRPCVDEYTTSTEMRAKFVGKRKEREEEEAANMQQKEEVSQKSSKSGDDINNNNKRSSAADNESLHDRQLRQAAEREALLRQMEQEDEELVHHHNDKRGEQQSINKSERTISSKTTTTKPTSSKTTKKKNIQQKFAPFPLQFPEEEEDQNQKRTPFEKLELYETKILGNILSKGEMQQMQLTR